MSTTTSITYTTTAPSLLGVWIHGISDPAASEAHLPYQDGERVETDSVNTAFLQFVGRRFPVAEYGEAENESIALKVNIPQDDDHDETVAWLRSRLRARETVCYRDNRGRVIFGSLGVAVGITDANNGTSADLTVTRLDYTEGE